MHDWQPGDVETQCLLQFCGQLVHDIFQSASVEAFRVSQLGNVIADYRLAEEESRRVIPSGQHIWLVPFHVVFAFAVNHHQTGHPDATSGLVHDWQSPDAESNFTTCQEER